MIEIAIEYKCRRCGAIDRSTRTGNPDIAITSIVEATIRGVSSGYGVPVSLVSVHICNDGGRGVSDLIGFGTVKESKPHTAGSGSRGSPHPGLPPE